MRPHHDPRGASPPDPRAHCSLALPHGGRRTDVGRGAAGGLIACGASSKEQVQATAAGVAPRPDAPPIATPRTSR